jgi:hypothetical protein
MGPQESMTEGVQLSDADESLFTVSVPQRNGSTGRLR